MPAAPITASPPTIAPSRRRVIPIAARRPGSRCHLTGVIALGHLPRAQAALRADDATREVVGLDVDPTPEPRLAGLVRGIEVGRPLEADVGRRAVLELQGSGRNRVAAATPGEVLAAGEGRQDRGGGP